MGQQTHDEIEKLLHPGKPGKPPMTGTGPGGESRARTAGPVPQPREADGLLAKHPGAPKARALLERQLTLGRSRAHSAALQELGSSSAIVYTPTANVGGVAAYVAAGFEKRPEMLDLCQTS